MGMGVLVLCIGNHCRQAEIPSSRPFNWYVAAAVIASVGLVMTGVSLRPVQRIAGQLRILRAYRGMPVRPMRSSECHSFLARPGHGESDETAEAYL
jgi:hypothetical protein